MLQEPEKPFLDQGEKQAEQISMGVKFDVLTPQEQIDLDTARTILQAIINTHENTITEATPLNQIAGYSTEQVRQAETLFAHSLMDEYGVRKSKASEFGFRRRNLIKATPEGRLQLSVGNENISLFLQKSPGTVVLANDFALKQPERGTEWEIGFTDHRPGGNTETLFGLNRQPSLQGIRHMLRGLRWMNANLLDWKNFHTIMPEQLDTFPLPASQHGKETS